MNTHTEIDSAPTWDFSIVSEEERSVFAAFWDKVSKRRDTLLLVHHLNQLVNTVQLHRGMSMSLLAGGDYFVKDMAKLQIRLRRQMIALEVFTDNVGDLFPAQHKVSLHRAWLTVTRDWQGDGVIDNFELHCHFIEELHAIVTALAERLSQPLFDHSAMQSDQQAEITVTYPQAFKQIELLNFVARQLPQVVELIARIRGLSCHAATTGKVNEVFERSLRFLIQNLRTENHKLRYQAERLKSIFQSSYRSIADINKFEMKLLFLFSCLEDDLLSKHGPTMEGHQLFKLATEIINIYSAVGEEGWHLVRRGQEKDWQAWIQNS